ncbi:MAG: hypothetical protein SWK90_15325 [Chloroflexota bacterium]|nr:hypothetical protein [Chloroflexota bacterium]
MGGKRCLWVVILLALVLALTGCDGNSAEEKAATAEYIRAKAYLIESEAHKVEQEAASLEQQREFARANAELAAERSRERQQAFIEISQIVVTVGLGVGSLLVLLHALCPLIRIWAEQRVRLLQAEAQALDRRTRWAELEKGRLKHERVLLEAQARVEAERQETLRLQAQAQVDAEREETLPIHPRFAQTKYRVVREQRWLEHEMAGGNGRK